MNRFYKLLMVTALVGVAMVTYGGAQAQAQSVSEWFPDSDTVNSGGASVHAMVSQSGTVPPPASDVITLKAEIAYFRVFIPAGHNGNVNIKIYKACNKTGVNDPGSNSIEAAILQAFTNDDTDGVANNAGMTDGGTKNASSCNTSGDIIFSVSGANFKIDKDRYGESVKTAIVRVQKTGSAAGIKSFKVNTSIGNVTFDDLGTERAKQAGEPSFAAFSIWDARPIASNPESNLQFEFQPDCKYSGQPVHLKWDDGDSGEDNEDGANNIGWKLYDLTAGGGPVASESGKALIGGNEAFNESDALVLEPTHRYVWRWENVNRRNGLQLWLPFSEASVGLPCQPPPKCNDPGQPACPVSERNCEVFELPMTAGDRYRFTVFDTRDVKHTATPAEGAVVNDGTEWAYKTFDRGPPVAQFHEDGGTTFKYDFPKTPTRDWIVYIEKWEAFDPPGTDTRDWRYSDGAGNNPDGSEDIGRSVQLDCYKADVANPACSISFSGSTVPDQPNGFPAGSTVTVSATMYNTGRARLPENFNGNKLSLSEPGSTVVPHYMETSIEPSASASVSYDLTASSTRGTHTVTLYPDYYGLKDIGPACSANYKTYERYDFDGSVSSSYDDPESPSLVTFTSSIFKQVPPGPGVDVDGKVTRSFFKDVGGVLASIDPVDNPDPQGNPHEATFGTANYTDSHGIPVDSFKLDDSWCGFIELDRGHGWRGPGDEYVNEGPAKASNCNPCPPGVTCNPPPPPVINIPYVRVYGNDVSAGGGFAPFCGVGATGSGIFAFMRPLNKQNPTDNQSGSGVQLAAMALRDVSGFTSAALRDAGEPRLPNGLTFSNITGAAPDPASTSPRLGGNLTSDGACLPDYFEKTQYPNDNTAKKTTRGGGGFTVDNALPSEQQTLANGDVTITGSTGFQRRHTVYVDGDAFINSNIAYDPSYGAGIPNFTLVVRGNIYISNNVSQLDGLYIAQPEKDAGTGVPVAGTGRIYTCATATGGVTGGTDLFSLCGAADSAEPDCNPADGNRQLRVNGSFVAERVVLNRTVYSLRCSTHLERVDTSMAAELFNFSPELYLSPPVFSPRSSSMSGEYDYITTLPPTL